MNTETTCQCGNEKAFDEKTCPECQEKEKRKDRRGFIGGSDIAAVMGLSHWSTPLQVWALKTGEVEPSVIESEAAEMGRELEDFVAKKFQRKTGLKVRKAPKNYTHTDYPYMRCQVDRLVESSDELLECKTCSAYKSREWEGEEIPQEYILQVMWQLGITGRKVGHIAVLIGGQAFKYKKIDFDQELFDKEVETARAFWQMIETKTPPMASEDDKEILLKLYPDVKKDELLQSFQEMEIDIARRQELSGHIKELIGQKEEIENRLRQVIGENLGIITQKYIVKNSRQNTALRVLFDKMRDDGVFDKYTQPNSTRVLRVSLNKENENGKRNGS